MTSCCNQNLSGSLPVKSYSCSLTVTLSVCQRRNIFHSSLTHIFVFYFLSLFNFGWGGFPPNHKQNRHQFQCPSHVTNVWLIIRLQKSEPLVWSLDNDVSFSSSLFLSVLLDQLDFLKPHPSNHKVTGIESAAPWKQ